jgi:hypothetical protein
MIPERLRQNKAKKWKAAVHHVTAIYYHEGTAQEQTSANGAA